MRRISLLFTAYLSLSCATLGDVGLHPVPPMVMQRDSTDCGIAVLAMLTGQRYETIAEDAKRVAGDIYVLGGLTPKQMVLIAAHFGHKLTLIGVETMTARDTGIVLAAWTDGTPSIHALFLVQQLAFDPLQPRPEAYVNILTAHKLLPLYFLREGG